MNGAGRRRQSSAPLHSLYAANAISFVGNNLTNIAIPWFVLVTTGSAAKTGITLFFSITPIVIAGFFGGALVDRLGYKRTSIIADLASGVTVAAIALSINSICSASRSCWPSSSSARCSIRPAARPARR